ncbi:hypothetical protein AQ837_22430 [Burkholderia pseudomallei]|nr:hypothetical protein AQ819_26345 [Burkholderia pseudomallei]OMY01510.1 hypothetical protein AQ837_22430 [Burkholderia pseudomallei]OMY14487.1 hypothetical protein AQ838_05320 [Burkholderia pseudomallei]OMY27762.1 hypothetical protein AQ839_02770 [Burkholderia pseudomallei]OMY30299.1 hypothetical protein AQ840_01960 [Burkholderia pseudomallei]
MCGERVGRGRLEAREAGADHVGERGGASGGSAANRSAMMSEGGRPPSARDARRTDACFASGERA